ncbi:MAG: SPOR domain-containing protein [Vicinamibacterales bacterium]
MSDQSFREIQLSGKQLVFLFMACIVLAVAVFLLGVSVGRGVGAPAAGGMSEAAAAQPSGPVELPPPTKVEPRDQVYQTALQGQATSVAPPPRDVPAAVPPPPDEASPVDEPQPVPSKTPPPAAVSPAPAPAAAVKPATPDPKVAAPATKPAPADAAAAKVPAGQGWTLQVDSFRSQENAARQAAQLKSRGMPAYVTPAGRGGLFQVRVGPFSQRAEAERSAARLRQQGMKPFLTH